MNMKTRAKKKEKKKKEKETENWLRTKGMWMKEKNIELRSLYSSRLVRWDTELREREVEVKDRKGWTDKNANEIRMAWNFFFLWSYKARFTQQYKEEAINVNTWSWLIWL